MAIMAPMDKLEITPQAYWLFRRTHDHWVPQKRKMFMYLIRFRRWREATGYYGDDRIAQG